MSDHPTPPGLTIPNPHVAKLRAISNRIAGTFPQCATDLSDIAVEMARMVRQIAALQAARPSATVLSFRPSQTVGIREKQPEGKTE